MSLLLEINDIGLALYNSGAVSSLQPGYAQLGTGDDLLLGDAALSASRLHPSRTENEYWHWMDTQPIKASSTVYRHNADLVYAQLSDLCGDGAKLAGLDLAVPSSYTADQLSMLLGIAQHAGIEVGQVFDTALLNSLGRLAEPDRAVVSVEMYLHQSVVTRLERRDGELVVTGHRAVADAGLVDFIDRILHGVADIFVRETRFDLLHDATTEQLAFDQIYAYYTTAEPGEAHSGQSLVVEIQNRPIELMPDQLQVMTEPLYRHIQRVVDSWGSAAETRRLISHRIARLPQWHAFLSTEVLDQQALAAGHSLVPSAPDQEGVKYVTSVPALAGEIDAPPLAVNDAPAPAADDPPAVDAATHILIGASAYPLLRPRSYLDVNSAGLRVSEQLTERTVCAIDASDELLRLEVIRAGEVELAGEAARPDTLRPGDVLGFSSVDMSAVLIRVTEGGQA